MSTSGSCTYGTRLRRIAYDKATMPRKLVSASFPQIEVLHLSGFLDQRNPRPTNFSLQVGPGIQVLYGKNGVGKTRVLDALPGSTVTVRRIRSNSAKRSKRHEWTYNQFGWSISETSFANLLDRFEQPSLRSGSYVWDFEFLSDTVTWLRETFNFVPDLKLDKDLEDRVYAVLATLVNPLLGPDIYVPVAEENSRRIVESIIEMLTSPIVSLGTYIGYRVILSDAPATSALLAQANADMDKRLRQLEADNFQSALDSFWTGESDWLDVLLSQGHGVLLEHLLDDPIGRALGEYQHWHREDPSREPIGALALLEEDPDSDSLPFTFVTEAIVEPTQIRSTIERNYLSSPEAWERFRNMEMDPDTGDFETLDEFNDHYAAAYDQSGRIEQWWLADAVQFIDQGLFDTTGPTELCSRLCDAFSAEVNRVYRMVLDGAPELVVRGVPLTDWDSKGRFICEALDQSGAVVGLDALSATQRRLANFALGLAVAAPDRHRIITLDEPEQGLHRRGEIHLVEGLHRISKELDATVIVASHSPAFLRPDLCTLHHVDRDPETGHVRLTGMSSVDVDRVAELGLTPSDLLQNISTILLVEGEHEVWVLSELFGEEFRRHGVLVSPLRGAKLLKSAVDAHLLFDFTSAEVVVMLDNESTERVEMIWNEALVAYESGGQGAVLECLDRLQDVKTGEARYLKEFCTRAIKLGARTRVGFQMMSEPDLDRYFPPSAFIRKQKHADVAGLNWEQIDALYEDWLVANQTPKGGHKEWLRREFGAVFDEKTYRLAVRTLDSVHPDFSALYRRVIGPGGTREIAST